jgi:hypothetical protein
MSEYKHYIDFAELRKDFPATCQMIDDENEGQNPCATFLEAAVGQYAVGDPRREDVDADLIALFDVGIPGEVLYVWVAGEITCSEPYSGAYIDEYYTMPIAEAVKQLSLVE